MIRALTLLLCLALPATAETAADRFAPKRAFSTDTWVTWLLLSDILAKPGFLDVYPDYPRVLPPGTLAAMAGHGFDTVRIVADPSPMLALWGTDRAPPLVENLAQRVIEAQAAGLKVILDLHARPTGDDRSDVRSVLGDPARFDTYLKIVAAVAGRLSNLDPSRTALELMNEPGEDCFGRLWFLQSKHWPDHLAALHSAARTAAPDLPLVLSGACWGGVDGLEAVDPALVADTNVIWSFHDYDPVTFTHQSAFWLDGPLMFLRDLPYPSDLLTDADAERIVSQGLARARTSTLPDAAQATPAALAGIVADYRHLPSDATTASIARAVAWADAHAIPHHRLLLGEFGAFWRPGDASATLDPDSHARFLAAKRSAAETSGIGWAVWSFSGPMAITDPGYGLNPQTCRALGLPRC